MDALEQYLRAGLELAGHDVDDTDLAVMRAVDAVYGDGMRALGQADLEKVWAEHAMDPSRPPEES